MTPDNLKAWRTQHGGMSQAKLATLLKLSLRTILRYESGEFAMPDTIELQLADVLKAHPALDWRPQAPTAPTHASRYPTGWYTMAGLPITPTGYASLAQHAFYLLHMPSEGWQIICRGSAWRGKCDGADPYWRTIPPWESAAEYDPATLNPDRCYFPMHETARFKRLPASDKRLPAPQYVLCRIGLCFIHE